MSETAEWEAFRAQLERQRIQDWRNDPGNYYWDANEEEWMPEDDTPVERDSNDPETNREDI